MTPAYALPERVLVTGGAGFIGSHLTDRLLSEGARVVVLDDLSTGRRQNLAAWPDDPRLTLVEGSVLDPATVDELVESCGLVFHLAAAVGVHYVVKDPVNAVLTNVRGTENVLASAHRLGVRVLLASTSEIYGRSEAIPFREDTDRLLGPTWVHRWSYSTAKAIDEHLAFAYSDKGLRVSIVRYFNAFGPRIDEKGYGSVIARFATQALRGEPITVHGDGQQSRCFTYVSDTVEGTLLAATRDAALGGVFNIGNAREVTIREIAERIRTGLGSRSPVVLVPYETYYPKGFQDTRRRVPDVTRAAEVLGFRAGISLEEGLERTLQWCRTNYAAGARSA